MIPTVSAIVPVFNDAENLGRCLRALQSSSFPCTEIIVVDDASRDDSAALAESLAVTVLRSPARTGPAAARNAGTRQARGDLLFFVDSDVVVRPETVGTIVEHFRRDGRLAALFGSYDSRPPAENFVSQYRNLLHHFIHQTSSPQAHTFWAGCGAVRRDLFFRLGGFDEKRYSRPSIEDIELGLRLTSEGHRIRLAKDLQVRHLKRWTLSSVVRTDIMQRALPWATLMLEQGSIESDLNLKMSHKISAGLVGLLALILCLSVLAPALLWTLPPLLAAVACLNRQLYRFFLGQRGPLFLMAAFPLHLLYYFYSGTAFLLCWIRRAGRPRLAAASRRSGLLEE